MFAPRALFLRPVKGQPDAMNASMHDGSPALAALWALDKRDLESLLATAPHELLGRIMRLNRSPRYRNSLNAVDVVQRILELNQGIPGHAAHPVSFDRTSGSSSPLPDSSGAKDPVRKVNV